MLKGKAKEDFEKWYKEKTKYDFSLNYIKLIAKAENTFNSDWMLEAFYCSDFSMQYGVLCDWFDSVGINISIEPYWCVCKLTMDVPQELTFDMMVFGDSENDYDYSNHTTRTQARQKAIERAIEIYNNK